MDAVKMATGRHTVPSGSAYIGSVKVCDVAEFSAWTLKEGLLGSGRSVADTTDRDRDNLTGTFSRRGLLPWYGSPAERMALDCSTSLVMRAPNDLPLLPSPFWK